MIALAAAIQLVPLAAPLLLSTDAWTYWSYGWIGARGDGNPYADPPADVSANPALSVHGRAPGSARRAVYGPAFTLASEPLAIVAGDSPTPLPPGRTRHSPPAASLAAALLAGRLARRRAFAIALVGWNPLLAVHLAGGGHNDAWVGALIIAALALSASRRLQSAGALWALAIAVKWVPILFLALRGDRGTHDRTPHGTSRVRRSRRLPSSSARRVLYGGAWPLAIFPLAGNAALETSYAIPHRLEQLGVPDDVALGVAVAAFVVGFACWRAEPRRGRARLALAACLVLVTTPYLAVWYLAWAVPLAAAEEDATATVACLVLCAYLLPQTIPI